MQRGSGKEGCKNEGKGKEMIQYKGPWRSRYSKLSVHPPSGFSFSNLVSEQEFIIKRTAPCRAPRVRAPAHLHSMVRGAGRLHCSQSPGLPCPSQSRCRCRATSWRNGWRCLLREVSEEWRKAKKRTLRKRLHRIVALHVRLRPVLRDRDRDDVLQEQKGQPNDEPRKKGAGKRNDG
jgi:hypothetical protein